MLLHCFLNKIQRGNSVPDFVKLSSIPPRVNAIIYLFFIKLALLGPKYCGRKIPMKSWILLSNEKLIFKFDLKLNSNSKITFHKTF